jgi:hypothetical protein
MTSTKKTVLRYRLRIGRNTFADPHYVTRIGRNPSYTSIMVNKQPISWLKKETAQKHFNALKEQYTTLEIEPYTAEK